MKIVELNGLNDAPVQLAPPPTPKSVSFFSKLGVSKIVIPGSIFEEQAPSGFSSYAMVKKMSSLFLQQIQEMQNDVSIFNPKLPPVTELNSNLLLNIGFFDFIDN